MIDSTQRIQIWDSAKDYPSFEGITILWNGLQERHDVISISSYVESNAEYFRNKFLAWVFEFGEKIIDNKKVIDFFLLPNGLSYWWMTSICQKFNISGTSPINNAIKILAIENIIENKGIKEIILFTGNRSLAKTLKKLCQEKSIRFEQCGKLNSKLFLFSINFIQAITYWIWYLYKFLISSLTRKVSTLSYADRDFCFIDNLVYLDKPNLNLGIFRSNYWNSIVNFLSESGYSTTWIHNFYAHKEISNHIKANKLVNLFNTTDKSQFHIIIESHLSISILFKTLKTYFQLVRKSFFFRKKTNKLPKWHSFLFTLLKDEFYESVLGRSAMKNCIRIELSEYFFRVIPKQKAGFYIQENQTWETAVLHSWKKNGHGIIIGIPHTTVRFWDLRYFYDKRMFQAMYTQNCLPLPDKIALNSPISKIEYLRAGYPEHCIEEVEALRYLHLTESKITRRVNERIFTLLICGDFLLSTTNQLLKFVEEAIHLIDIVPNIIVKPHPSRPIKAVDYPGLLFSISEKPLHTLFSECDATFTSNVSSAAVDAYYSGIKLIQLLDGNYFNMSPLREVADIKYVRNGKDLAACLINNLDILLPKNPYFFLDSDLPRWKVLLNKLS